MENKEITGKDFEFLIVPNDIEISEKDFDNVMTPNSFMCEKTINNDWIYYKVGEGEFSYSWEIAGIQMIFNNEIKYEKAKMIADEGVENLTQYTKRKIILQFVPANTILKI